jgi:hypothetical protein
MQDLGKLVERLIAAAETANEHQRAAYEAVTAASLISGQIAKHPHIESLPPEAMAQIEKWGAVAEQFKKAFFGIYGAAQ